MTGPDQLMQIGELAERTELSLRTIRHYDDEGLLTPSARSTGGFRLYSSQDLDRLMVIRRMKPLGFSIDEMRDLLDILHRLSSASTAAGEIGPLRDRLDGFRSEAVQRRDRLRIQLDRAEEFVDTLEGLAGGDRGRS
ncbi:MerR family transcriptional regulator [Nakamurella sp. YIM 132087]|uniref:MerR family transcriptional regulator n=1 Tax=Nakamurella alba TaxID=2665158 RepID=A0A7K1FI82_9ACTN|nr:MerR family transcriptional regulator [Nakamurella alba]MTD13837.1 MerR family transcriptional regulator [Nakamurella alba]